MQGHNVTKFGHLPGFAPDDIQENDPHLQTNRGWKSRRRRVGRGKGRWPVRPEWM